MQLVWYPRDLEGCRQYLPVVESNPKVPKAKLNEHIGGGREDLGLDGHRRRTDGVDVALIELAKTALLRAVGAPDGLNLVALEELRQLRSVFGHHARKRHRHVVAER